MVYCLPQPYVPLNQNRYNKELGVILVISCPLSCVSIYTIYTLSLGYTLLLEPCFFSVIGFDL